MWALVKRCSIFCDALKVCYNFNVKLVYRSIKMKENKTIKGKGLRFYCTYIKLCVALNEPGFFVRLLDFRLFKYLKEQNELGYS